MAFTVAVKQGKEKPVPPFKRGKALGANLSPIAVTLQEGAYPVFIFNVQERTGRIGQHSVRRDELLWPRRELRSGGCKAQPAFQR